MKMQVARYPWGLLLLGLFLLNSCAEGPYRQMSHRQVSQESKARKKYAKDERKNTKNAIKEEKKSKKSPEWKEYEQGLKRHHEMQNESTRGEMKSYKKRNSTINNGRRTNPHRSFWDRLFGRNKSKYSRPKKKRRVKDEWAG